MTALEEYMRARAAGSADAMMTELRECATSVPCGEGEWPWR
ncbi:hypothetical protein [Brachybacterium sp. YJGR34]|nr:hypothetical protein [Brachybacterium sp. YJGR34]